MYFSLTPECPGYGRAGRWQAAGERQVPNLGMFMTYHTISGYCECVLVLALALEFLSPARGLRNGKSTMSRMRSHTRGTATQMRTTLVSKIRFVHTSGEHMLWPSRRALLQFISACWLWVSVRVMK